MLCAYGFYVYNTIDLDHCLYLRPSMYAVYSILNIVTLN